MLDLMVDLMVVLSEIKYFWPKVFWPKNFFVLILSFVFLGVLDMKNKQKKKKKNQRVKENGWLCLGIYFF